MFKLNTNKEVLSILVKDYINSEKKSYIEKVSGKQIPFNNDEIASVSKILAEQTNGTGIHVKDIDKAIDAYLMENNYAYEGSSEVSLSKQYVFKTEDNYYYYSLIELDIFGGARSISEAMSLISRDIKNNAKAIKKNSAIAASNKINLSVVKDNSTKYIQDKNPMRVMHGSYDVTTGEISLKCKVDDLNNMYSNC
jgi:hypothetical protein